MNSNYKSFFTFVIALFTLVNPTFAQDKEALEIGGTVKLDYAADIEHLDEGDPEIGEVELTSVVNIDEDLRAAIKIKTDGSLKKLKIDKALAEYKPTPVVVLTFGQQSIGHGLVSTHLISDPWLKGNGLDIKAPSFSLKLKTGIVQPILSLGYLQKSPSVSYEVVDDGLGNLSVSEISTKNPGYYRGLAGFIFEPSKVISVRTSLTMGKDRKDMVIGGEIGVEKLTIDIEGYHVFDDIKDAKIDGMYTGLAYQINDYLSLATRYDLLSQNELEDVNHRIAGGATFSLSNGLFASIEYSHETPSVGDATNTIALQFGLESKLKIPGFERKTLSNP